jgi:hypothetical protein
MIFSDAAISGGYGSIAEQPFRIRSSEAYTGGNASSSIRDPLGVGPSGECV